ncbi:MAG: DNA repair protein RecO [Candidatus Paceibacterota bacterium]|jgi:DNA repair protein RecO
MHHIYHTEGIVFSSKNIGESGRYYKIFTKDLGMITARAEGVRKISSKLRYILQDFSYLKIDLIKGKNFWKITSASKTNLLEDITKNKDTFRIFSNILNLLSRLLSGEEVNTPLFFDIKSGLIILESVSTKTDLKNTEVVLVLRILKHLGYISENKILTKYINSSFEKSLISKVSIDRKNILREINRALKETQL